MTDEPNNAHSSLTVEEAREIVAKYQADEEFVAISQFPEYREANGFLQGVESERAKHLERIAQEKDLLEQEKKHLRIALDAAARAMKRERAEVEECLEVADRMAECKVYGDDAELTDLQDAYRAARAKLDGGK